MRKYRGTLTEPGKESPYRNRSVEENLDLFERMRAGEFPDGSRTLRAKIDMASPNLNMRDPVMYRILHAEHHRTGNKWCIYPMYDFAHGQSRFHRRHHALHLHAGIRRPPSALRLVYRTARHLSSAADRVRPPQPHLHAAEQAQAARRWCRTDHVRGWDDPRMPTISGIRRRGYTPEAMRNFCGAIGVSKTNGIIELGLLEHFVREDLNKRALRVMAVLRPLRVVIDNYPEGQVEEMEAVNNPEDASAGTRKVPFSRVLYIEQDDFREDPPKQYFRLSPGREVRLRYGYFITCTGVVKNDAGEVVEVHCTYDPATRGGNAPDGRKVKSTIHWVSAAHAVDAEVRLYETLFTREESQRDRRGPGLHRQSESEFARSADRLQTGAEPGETPRRAAAISSNAWATSASIRIPAPGKPVFNRTVALRDTWAKIEKRQVPNDHSRNRRIARRRRRGHPERWRDLAAAVEEAKLVRRRLNWARGRGSAASTPSPTCLQLAGVRPRRGGLRRGGAARSLSQRLHPKLRARISRQPAVWWWSITWRTPRRRIIASPFEDATVLTLDRGGDFRCGARWRAEGRDHARTGVRIYPDSLGDLYGRVTEAARLRSRCRRAQGAVALRRRRRPLHRAVPRNRRAATVMARASIARSSPPNDSVSGGFSARFYERLGLAPGRRDSRCAAPAHRSRRAERRRRGGRSAWRATARISASPAAWA